MLLKNALAPLSDLLDDPLVQEIEVNGPDNVWVERAGSNQEKEHSIKISDVQIKTAVHLLGRLNGKDAKAGCRDGIIDARMEGFRIAAALQPTSVHGSSICIRKHNPLVLSLDDYVQKGSFSPEIAEFIRRAIHDHKNILIAGGTSSGKTTFANAMIAEIPPHERVVTIEDTPELKVKAPNWVSFEANEQSNISSRDLVRLSLRYRPDRIIVGEIRAGEAYDLLDAANTGHDGVMSTIHANSSFDALSRLETLVLRGGVPWPHRAICRQIARTFDFVFFMARRQGGVRKLCEILSLKDYDITKEEYVYEMVFETK